MTFTYALASAHGEFMERLENQAIIRAKELAYKESPIVKGNTEYYSFLIKNGLLLNYQYAPDEAYKDVTSENIQDILKNLCVYNKENIYQKYKGKKIALLPFYNLTKRSVEYLPYDIVFLNCTSNGMCAGNTPKEAIIQGISEIIERYILREIYMKGLSLPTIPKEYFEGTEILSKIEQLEKKYGNNWNFVIKDCSLGNKYPAVGILMLNITERKYLFHLGVDPSPITALERSLTEIFQGRENAAILDIDYAIQSNIISNPKIQDAEFYKTCTTGSGHYPISILEEPANTEFFGFDKSWGMSDESDLKKLLSVIEKNGRQVFIRDVSFLGFPAYCIYIPGMTEFRNVIKDNCSDKNLQLKLQASNAAFDLYDASEEQIKSLIECVNNDQKFIAEIMKFDSQSFLVKYDTKLTLCVLNIAIRNFKEAYKNIFDYFSTFTGTDKEKLFFSALKDMLFCKSRNIDNERLALLYGRFY